MSTNPEILTSKAILMHASLAYLTVEIQTLDDIIHSTHMPSLSRSPILPNEILFLIREWLFPTITTQLIRKSVLALEAYERSLYDLLCSDCAAYNVDIYGSDIWQWEQFYGACACAAPAGTEDPHGYRSARINRRHGQENYRSESITVAGPKFAHVINGLNPKKFANVNQWLEFYLSNEAEAINFKQALRIDVAAHNGQLMSPQENAWPVASGNICIWDVVTIVLRDFSCEAVRDQLENRGQSNTKRDLVRIVPSRCHMDWEPNAGWTQREGSTQSHSAQAILHRASRDLGLMVEYPEALDFKITGKRRPFINPTFTRRLCWSSASRTYCARSSQEFLKNCQTLLRVVASLAGACLSFPVTCAALALTVLCFYSKPRSLRII